MPKIIIDMGLLDHLLIKFHRKFNVVADMSLQQGKKSQKFYAESAKNFNSFFINFIKLWKNPRWDH